MNITYQDLLSCGQDERRRMDFIRSAVNQHRSSDIYEIAVAAQKYYDGENPTINKYEKILYDMQGRAHRDMYTANHKIASRFFGFVVDQANSYLLGNGVTFPDGTDKGKLGSDFDRQVSRAAEYAMIGGVSFVGGIGRISGIVVGVLLLQIIFTGLNFLAVDANMLYIIKGLIILIACAIDMRKYLVRK